MANHYPTIRVVAAVLHDGQGQVLIAERPVGKPLAGYWEFPGGKLEAGEMPRSALSRELHEELGITVQGARPLIRFTHDYPERLVELDVWRVTRYHGEIQAREGQRLAWVRPEALRDCNLLPADLPIQEMLRLPPRMLVTPVPGNDTRQFMEKLRQRLDAGIEFVQLRAPGMAPESYRALARQVIACCREQGARIVLNAAPELAEALGADGVHLDSVRLRQLSARPVPASLLAGAACHNQAELQQARNCKLDYAVLGPVLPTHSHPGAPVLGWKGFAALASDAGLPVYAIGGMRATDMQRAREAGGYGVAAIRDLWRDGSVAADYGS